MAVEVVGINQCMPCAYNLLN